MVLKIIVLLSLLIWTVTIISNPVEAGKGKTKRSKDVYYFDPHDNKCKFISGGAKRSYPGEKFSTWDACTDKHNRISVKPGFGVRKATPGRKSPKKPKGLFKPILKKFEIRKQSSRVRTRKMKQANTPKRHQRTNNPRRKSPSRPKKLKMESSKLQAKKGNKKHATIKKHGQGKHGLIRSHKKKKAKILNRKIYTEKGRKRKQKKNVNRPGTRKVTVKARSNNTQVLANTVLHDKPARNGTKIGLKPKSKPPLVKNGTRNGSKRLTKKGRYRKRKVNKSGKPTKLIYDNGKCYDSKMINGKEHMTPKSDSSCYYYEFADKTNKTCHLVVTTDQKIAPSVVSIEKCAPRLTTQIKNNTTTQVKKTEKQTKPEKMTENSETNEQDSTENVKYKFNPKTDQCEPFKLPVLKNKVGTGNNSPNKKTLKRLKNSGRRIKKIKHLSRLRTKKAHRRLSRNKRSAVKHRKSGFRGRNPTISRRRRFKKLKLSNSNKNNFNNQVYDRLDICQADNRMQGDAPTAGNNTSANNSATPGNKTKDSGKIGIRCWTHCSNKNSPVCLEDKDGCTAKDNSPVCNMQITNEAKELLQFGPDNDMITVHCKKTGKKECSVLGTGIKLCPKGPAATCFACTNEELHIFGLGPKLTPKPTPTTTPTPPTPKPEPKKNCTCKEDIKYAAMCFKHCLDAGKEYCVKAEENCTDFQWTRQGCKSDFSSKEERDAFINSHAMDSSFLIVGCSGDRKKCSKRISQCSNKDAECLTCSEEDFKKLTPNHKLKEPKKIGVRCWIHCANKNDAVCVEEDEDVCMANKESPRCNMQPIEMAKFLLGFTPYSGAVTVHCTHTFKQGCKILGPGTQLCPKGLAGTCLACSKDQFYKYTNLPKHTAVKTPADSEKGNSTQVVVPPPAPETKTVAPPPPPKPDLGKNNSSQTVQSSASETKTAAPPPPPKNDPTKTNTSQADVSPPDSATKTAAQPPLPKNDPPKVNSSQTQTAPEPSKPGSQAIVPQPAPDIKTAAQPLSNELPTRDAPKASPATNALISSIQAAPANTATENGIQ